MTQNLLNALAITGIGMGLVFGALGLLWALIAALTRALADRPATEGPTAPAPAAAPAIPADAGQSRRRAAIAAVAVALALQREAEATRPLAAGSLVSPWQTAMRGRQLRERRSLR